MLKTLKWLLPFRFPTYSSVPAVCHLWHSLAKWCPGGFLMPSLTFNLWFVKYYTVSPTDMNFVHTYSTVKISTINTVSAKLTNVCIELFVILIISTTKECWITVHSWLLLTSVQACGPHVIYYTVVCRRSLYSSFIFSRNVNDAKSNRTFCIFWSTRCSSCCQY